MPSTLPAGAASAKMYGYVCFAKARYPTKPSMLARGFELHVHRERELRKLLISFLKNGVISTTKIIVQRII